MSLVMVILTVDIIALRHSSYDTPFLVLEPGNSAIFTVELSSARFAVALDFILEEAAYLTYLQPLVRSTERDPSPSTQNLRSYVSQFAFMPSKAVSLSHRPSSTSTRMHFLDAWFASRSQLSLLTGTAH